MPQSGRHVGKNAAMVAVGDIAPLVKVRDVGEFRPHSAMLAHCEMTAGIHRAEMTREGELPVLGELLIAEHEHRVAIHRRLDLPNGRVRKRRAQVDAGGAGGEQRMQWREAQRHRLSLCRGRCP